MSVMKACAALLAAFFWPAPRFSPDRFVASAFQAMILARPARTPTSRFSRRTASNLESVNSSRLTRNEMSATARR